MEIVRAEQDRLGHVQAETVQVGIASQQKDRLEDRVEADHREAVHKETVQVETDRTEVVRKEREDRIPREEGKRG